MILRLLHPNLLLLRSLLRMAGLALLITLSPTLSYAKVLYVDPISGNNSVSHAANSGWGSAWKDLVHALYWAQSGDEIWLNTGTYYPIQSGVGTPWADRSKAFWTHSNVKIYGGFSIAAGATTMGTRNAAAYPAILSGEIQQDGNPTNNSYCLIKTYYQNGLSLIDGVTIQGAYDKNGYGGGMYLNYVSPTVNNVQFIGNAAAQGGGMYCDKSSPAITNCTFQDNVALHGGAGFFSVMIVSRGGGVYCNGSSPTISSCTFTGNRATYGSAICSDTKAGSSSPVISACTFSGNINNSYMDSGGPPTIGSVILCVDGAPALTSLTIENNHCRGIHLVNAAATVDNCIIRGNNGGGIMVNGSGGAKIRGCYIYGNVNVPSETALLNHGFKKDGIGGGIALVETKTPLPLIANCQINGNTAEKGGGIYYDGSTADVVHCTVTGNHATVEGGGIWGFRRGFTQVAFTFYYNTSTAIKNCIVTDNSAATSPQQANVFFVPTSTQQYFAQGFFTVFDFSFKPDINNSLIGDAGVFASPTKTKPGISTMDPKSVMANDLGGNLLNMNPRFNNAAAADYSLDPCSPCWDTGDPAAATAAALGTDLVGTSRIVGSNPDMGCFERPSASPGYTFISTVSICEGGSATINGVSQSVAGTYAYNGAPIGGCTSTYIVTLVVNPLPAVAATSLDNCFATGTLDLKPIAGKAPFSVTVNGNTQGVAAGGSAQFTGLAGGNYPFTLTDANGCAASGTAQHTTNLLNSTIIYVDSAATGQNNGDSWKNAFTDLQDALTLASCAGVSEIRVSKGTYYPSRNPARLVVSDPTATFRMKAGVRISGGYDVAGGDSLPADRDWQTNVTVLSGDIQRDGIATNNVYNVINNYQNGLDATAVLDGFTITGAYNTYDWGGGRTNAGAVINFGSSPTFENCIISDNAIVAAAEGYGAGMYNQNCAPTIVNCQFLRNTITAPTTAYGAAICNFQSSPNLSRCVISFNVPLAGNKIAGGMYSSGILGGTPIQLNSCLFTNNHMGALVLDNSPTHITNCTVAGNDVSGTGFAGGIYSLSCTPVILNSIFWGNSNGSISTYLSTPICIHSNLQGSGGSIAWNTAYGSDGGGNQEANPKFSYDFHLTACSPARNAGFNNGLSTLDLDGNPRLYESTVDLGCYEIQASLGMYGATVYVDSAATGLNNGTSWANAFRDLQDALTLANCTGIANIWVAKGTYYPTMAPGDAPPASAAQQTFQLRNNVSVVGGFSPANGALDLSTRNHSLYPTILSGDYQRDGNPQNNAFNVINNYGNGLNNSAVLSGFTITGAYNSYDYGAGNTTSAGIINYISSPTFVDCIISGNTIAATNNGYGAGAYNLNAAPVFIRCTFRNNVILAGNTAYGAGIYDQNSAVTYTDCVFEYNQANGSFIAYGGGAGCNNNTGTSFNRCRFHANYLSATNIAGGAIYLTGGVPVSVDNCLFTSNPGGAITSDNNSLVIKNSTFYGNIVPHTAYAGGLYSLSCTPTITNSIFYENSNGNISLFSSVPNISYCLIGGSGGSAAWNAAYGTDLGGNLDANPQLTATFHLSACSPARNAGTNAGIAAYDLDNQSRLFGPTVDMGCFESLFDPSVYTDPKLYVNHAASGIPNGTSWSNAFTTLGDALMLTTCLPSITEVWVSKGTYFPTRDVTGAAVSNSFATFQMRNNLAILGGFSVADGATTAGSRNPALYQTILSGDLQQDDLLPNNAFNLINNYATGLNATAVLDGFTLTKAYNSYNWGGGVTRGGAMINVGSSPTVRNCIFAENFIGCEGQGFGAAIYNESCAPVIEQCVFSYNAIASGGLAYGGAICNENATATLRNCSFNGNMVASGSGVVGGSVYQNGGAPLSITNCTFTNGAGASVHVVGNNAVLLHNTFTGSGAGAFFSGGSPAVTNCIFYGNGTNIVNSSANPAIHHSLVGGSGGSAAWNPAYGTDLGGNLDADPLLTSTDLTGPDGRFGTADDGLYPQFGSPAINAGTNTGLPLTDRTGQKRRYGSQPDMGAYERHDLLIFTPIATAGQSLAADAEYTDGSGWTHYVNEANNKLLLSVWKNGNAIGTVGDGVFTVTASTTPTWSGTAASLITAPYVSNASGWYVMNRWWNLNPTSQPTGDVQIRSYFTQTDLDGLRVATGDNGLATDQLRFYKINGTTSPDPSLGHSGLAAAGSYDVPGYWEYAPGMSGTPSTWMQGQHNSDFYAEMTVRWFSGGGGGGASGGGGAFPVEFTGIDAFWKKPGFATVSWNIAKEEHILSYTVESSLDGNLWAAAGTIPPANVLQYTFDDPTERYEPRIFYRVVALDADGKTTVSSIVEVSANHTTAAVQIWPNPAGRYLHIGGGDLVESVTLRDLQGRELLKKEVEEGELSVLLTLPSGLPAGVYQLQIRTATRFQTLIFIHE